MPELHFQPSSSRVVHLRPHPLSKLLEATATPALAQEPWELTEAEQYGLTLTQVAVDARGVSWGLQEHWSQVRIQSSGLLRPMPAPAIERSASRRMLLWGELPPCAGVDLTPVGAQGEGAVVRLRRPATCLWEPVRFDLRGDQVLIGIHASQAAATTELFALRLVNNWEFEPIDGTRLTRSVTRIRPSRSLRGALAVVGTTDEGGRCLLDAVEWSGGQLAAARTVLALDEAGAAALIDDAPRGAVRLLALRALGLRLEDDPFTLAARLHEGGFEAAIGRVWPAFAPLLSTVSESALPWLIRELSTSPADDLVEVVAWSGGRDAAAMATARALLPARARLRSLEAEARPGSPVAAALAAISEKISTLPSFVQAEAVDQTLGALEARLKADREAPLDPLGEAPSTLERFAEWRVARARAIRWRHDRTALIGFLRDGRWLETPPVDDSDPGALPPLAPLPAVDLPADLPEWLPAPEEAQLRAWSQELRDRSLDEPDLRVRKATTDFLRGQVLPDPARWCRVHHALTEARRVVASHPEIARSIDFDEEAQRPLGEILGKVVDLLGFEAALAESLRRWPISASPLLISRASTPQAALLDPDADRVRSTWATCRSLSLRLGAALCLSDPLTNILKFGAIDPTLAAWRARWADLTALVSLHEQLLAQVDEQDRFEALEVPQALFANGVTP